MEYLPMADVDEYGGPRPIAVTVAMLEALAEDIDAFCWANPDISTENLLKTIGECCQEAGLGIGSC